MTTGLTGTYYIRCVFTGQYEGPAPPCLLRLVFSVQGVKCAMLGEVVSSENEFSHQRKGLALEITHSSTTLLSSLPVDSLGTTQA